MSQIIVRIFLYLVRLIQSMSTYDHIYLASIQVFENIQQSEISKLFPPRLMTISYFFISYRWTILFQIKKKKNKLQTQIPGFNHRHN